MKLLTLNCHSWQESNQIDKIKYLAKVIIENNYDVIALQEVSQHIDSKLCEGKLRADNYMLLLKKELKKICDWNFDSVWDFSHIGYDIYEEGLCILSKHKITHKDSFYVSRDETTDNWKSRKVVKASIDYKGEELDFISCHLGWWNDEEEPFKLQVEKLNKKVDSNKRTFLLGDFNNNANVRNEGYDFIKESGWIDTYEIALNKDEGSTVKGKIDGWDKNRENLRLDLILTNKSINVESSKVIFNQKNKDIISDHYGVEVYLNI
ncbi:MAG: endonuclease/exonuclease/phosphatase family protein [Clostridiaceae bacterium]|nr:endonuclease/exonuclease/phosphatase family protein [Clostridiaceae bacterium]